MYDLTIIEKFFKLTPNVALIKEALDMKIERNMQNNNIDLSVAVYSYPRTDPTRGIGV